MTTVIDTSGVWPAVWRAVSCHKTQMTTYRKLEELSEEHQRSLWGTALIYDLITYRDKNIADATYNAAVAKFGEKGVTDAIGLASYYGITAMSLIAAKATFPPGDEPTLQAVAQPFPK